jgi:hypothetical protein
MEVNQNRYNANYYKEDTADGYRGVNNKLTSPKVDINKEAEAYILQIKEIGESNGSAKEKYSDLHRLEQEFNEWVKQQKKLIESEPEPQKSYDLMQLNRAELKFQNTLIAALEEIKEKEKKKSQSV